MLKPTPIQLAGPQAPVKAFPTSLGALPRRARFIDENFYIWCGSMTRTPDGRCHLYYSRWPRELGHYAWVSHSVIAYATADEALGPYRHASIALPPRGEDYWDGLCTHNPTVCQFGDRYYLYYMGTRGEAQDTRELNWSYRNNQRIGVAVAADPAGPWRRFDRPLIDRQTTPLSTVCCSNPTVTRRPDGKYLMIYKAVGDRDAPPAYGPVVHLAAIADDPLGPFVTHPEPVFEVEGVNFAAEDPFVWYENGNYHAIVKDMGGHFTDAGKSLVRFFSPDGLNWHLAVDPLVSVPELTWEDGSTQRLHSLERPQVYFEDGVPRVLFCAADLDADRGHSFNVHIPMK